MDWNLKTTVLKIMARQKGLERSSQAWADDCLPFMQSFRRASGRDGRSASDPAPSQLSERSPTRLRGVGVWGPWDAQQTWCYMPRRQLAPLHRDLACLLVVLHFMQQN